MAETEDYDKSATPTAHKTTHQDGGSDEISVTGLSGLLADGQTPLAHKTSHQDAGTDEISVTGLSGTLADDQHIIDSEAVSAMGTKGNSNPLNHDRYADSEALAAAVQSGAITDGVTKAPTHDAVYDVAALLLDHSTRHENDGLDEISVEGLAGLLTSAQKVTVRKNTGADVGTRKRLNLVEGTNITLTVADDAVGDEVDITIAASGGGKIVQVVNYQTGAVATGTNLIPNDDTVPLNTEGDQYMTLAITPTNINNKLLIEVITVLSNGAAGFLATALFQDDGANALAVQMAYGGGWEGPIQGVLKHYMTAGTTSSTTFKVRCGNDQAGTTTFNGYAGVQRYGGVMASSITITEIAT